MLKIISRPGGGGGYSPPLRGGAVTFSQRIGGIPLPFSPTFLVYKASLFLRNLDIYSKATRAPLSPRKNYFFFTHEFNEKQISPALSFAFLILVLGRPCHLPSPPFFFQL